MGQAFDRDGNVLGEAFGDTKREVFDKLNAEFKQAHEIRIRALAPEAPDDPARQAVEAARQETLLEIERVRVGFSQHKDVAYALGATAALDELSGWLRRMTK
jgi:hypothetical protein